MDDEYAVVSIVHRSIHSNNGAIVTHPEPAP